jgi:predicted small lipoprotein YifL
MRRTPALLAVTFVLAACGSRGPLDDTPVGDAGRDTSTLDASSNDAAADVVTPVDAGSDAPPNPIDCLQCVQKSCGTKLVDCLQDVDCRGILQCAAQKCLSGGALDPKCLSTCANGNLGGLAQAFSAFQCVTSKCGDQCLPLLGGLGN